MKISALRTCLSECSHLDQMERDSLFRVFTPRITWNLTVVTRRSQPCLALFTVSNHRLTWKYEWIAPAREIFYSRVDLALCSVGDI